MAAAPITLLEKPVEGISPMLTGRKEAGAVQAAEVQAGITFTGAAALEVWALRAWDNTRQMEEREALEPMIHGQEALQIRLTLNDLGLPESRLLIQTPRLAALGAEAAHPPGLHQAVQMEQAQTAALSLK